jgi:archaellum biogenesis ATPase FlaH
MNGKDHARACDFDVVSTGLPRLDELLMGGLPVGTMVHIFGRKGVGKSILAFQLAFQYAMREGRSVFYLDTELGFRKSIGPHWYEKFCNRFKKIPLVRIKREKPEEEKADKKRRPSRKIVEQALRDGLKDLGVNFIEEQLKAASRIFLSFDYRLTIPKVYQPPSIFVLEEPSLKDILALFGVNVRFIISDSGKVETRLQPGTQLDVRLTPIGRFCAKYDAGLIVFDSISAPLKSMFSGTQDLPGRASAMNFWFGQARKLCNSFDCTVLALNHESFAPTPPHKSTYYGGGPVGFDFKYSLHLQRREEKWKPPKESLNVELASEANRILWSQRFPDRPDYGACVLLRLSDEGFI